MKNLKRKAYQRRSRWLRPGIGIKRWIALGVAGMTLIVLALAGALRIVEQDSLARYRLPIYLASAGTVLFLTAICILIAKLWRLPAQKGGMGANVRWTDVLFNEAVLDKGPKITALGGGTGMSTLLRGLKNITSHLTAVVTVADDGGNSGQLRDDLGILPPGDIRNCMVALCEAEPAMEQLLQYRFPEGALKGQCMGNLLLAAMNDIAGGFLESVEQMQNVLAVHGRILPVSLDHLTLMARMSGGEVVSGESQVGHGQSAFGGRIDRVWLDPAECKALPEALSSIRKADILVLGPGSLYTSILPNLLVPGVVEAIHRSNALKIYVANLMTQGGETEGYTVEQHMQALLDHVGPGLVDVVLVNNQTELPRDVRARYEEENAQPASYDIQALEAMGVRVVERDLLKGENGRVRHSFSRLALAIRDIYLEERG